MHSDGSRLVLAGHGRGVSFPVQLSFGDGDTVGAQRAFHNAGAADDPSKELQAASHTCVALGDNVTTAYSCSPYGESLLGGLQLQQSLWTIPTAACSCNPSGQSLLCSCKLTRCSVAEDTITMSFHSPVSRGLQLHNPYG